MIYWHMCPAQECAGNGATRPDFLSAVEFKTYQGLRFPKRRHEWLLGRWTAKQLLRHSLASYEGLPLEAISVANDPDGAPYLAVEGEGRLPVSLSISHRAGRAVCALSPAASPSIGVDLEYVETRAPAFVNDFFTAEESARVWACPDPLRDTLVTVIWSAKEAVLKALREGLRLDTRAVEIAHVAGLEDDTGAADVDVTLQRVGSGLADEQWHPVTVSCAVPGVLRCAAWWCPDGDSVLTAAAVWP